MFIVISKNAWGKAKTEQRALTEMRKHLSDPKHRNQYVVFEVEDKNAYVNFFGNIVSVDEPREVRRVGLEPATK